jgi:MoaE-MoaD fusion protein
MIKVLLFARLREMVGQDVIELESGEVQTVRDVWSTVRARFPQSAGFEKSLLFAVNQEFVNIDTIVREGDEVAMFPPVSGGESADLQGIYPEDQSGDVYQIVYQKIRVERLVDQLKKPHDGATVIFAGIVRNNSLGRRTLYLEYEAYEPMALRRMREIGLMIKQKWDIHCVGIVHRLGKLEIGEASVILVITSAHRHAAFEACHFAIDTLKKTVPIWKKEFFEDGEVWVEGDRDRDSSCR